MKSRILFAAVWSLTLYGGGWLLECGYDYPALSVAIICAVSIMVALLLTEESL